MSYNTNHLALPNTPFPSEFPESGAFFPSCIVRLSKYPSFATSVYNVGIVIQKSVSTNVAVNFHSAANIKTFTQVPLPPPTRPSVSNNVMWKCLTLFISFSTGAQLVPQDNIVHVVELTILLSLESGRSVWDTNMGGGAVFVCFCRMLWLQSLGYCDCHIHSVPETHPCNLRTNYYNFIIRFLKAYVRFLIFRQFKSPLPNF